MDKYDNMIKEEEKILKELTEKLDDTIKKINKEWQEEKKRNSNLPYNHPKMIDIDDYFFEETNKVQNAFNDEIQKRLDKLNKQIDGYFYSFDFSSKKLLKLKKEDK